MKDRYAVVGNPIVQSLSPRIHTAFADQVGDPIEYEKLLVEPGEFENFAHEFFAGGGKGLNVTMPFKLDARDFASVLTERARTAGAVNTLALQDDGSILGDNTDGAGLVRDITCNLGWPVRGKRVLLLGAGGAVRGVLLPLMAEAPASLHIANRTPARAEALAADFAPAELSASGFEDATGPFDLVINGTAASLSGAVPALPREALAPGCCFYDMVYGARPTVAMQWAREQGAEAADGLGMLVEQAAEAFVVFRGCRPDTAPVLAALREQIST